MRRQRIEPAALMASPFRLIGIALADVFALLRDRDAAGANARGAAGRLGDSSV